ncbi:hypothetical protein BdWA1_000382 [Babesia duncani]|uniref:Uncharacterized protein n=1 Tax=Babesia duncani TaxID=323732 RepID=A0AAD9PN44_9APIC|nr:hypothetical protein BdWA1_000382 [Babesia duncani]
MGFFGTLFYVAYTPLRIIRYKTASDATKANVIKLGIICRKSWILFPPLLLYQYIRAIDREMYTTEVFYKASKSNDSRAFYDPTKPKGFREWKIQSDMALVSKAISNHTMENESEESEK